MSFFCKSILRSITSKLSQLRVCGAVEPDSTTRDVAANLLSLSSTAYNFILFSMAIMGGPQALAHIFSAPYNICGILKVLDRMLGISLDPLPTHISPARTCQPLALTTRARKCCCFLQRRDEVTQSFLLYA